MTREYEILQSQKRIEARLEALIEVIQTLQRTLDESRPQYPKYVYGLKGIAQLFGCSTSTAQRIKSSGVIDPAIRQRNRRIIVDTQTALRLFDDPICSGRYGFVNKKRK